DAVLDQRLHGLGGVDDRDGHRRLAGGGRRPQAEREQGGAGDAQRAPHPYQGHRVGEDEHGALEQTGGVEVAEAETPLTGDEQRHEERDEQGERHRGRRSKQRREAELGRSPHAFLHCGWAGSSTPGRWSSLSTSAATDASAVRRARALTPSSRPTRASSVAIVAVPVTRRRRTPRPTSAARRSGSLRAANARETSGSSAGTASAATSARLPPVKRPSRSLA